MAASYNEQGKIPGILAYVTIFGTLIAFFLNKDEKNTFANFHIRQALGLHLANILLTALANTFDSLMISTAFYLFYIVLIIYGLIGAIKLDKNKVPLLGSYFQEWFTFIN